MPLASSTIRPNAADLQEMRFIVGQDARGRWVAVEAHGLAGGLFRSCAAAIHYAAGETQRRPDAVVISAEKIELRL